MIKLIPQDKHEQFVRVTTRINEVRKRIRNLNHPVAMRMFDYLSEVEEDVDLALRVIDYFRAYYGQNHPRLAIKLYLTSQMSQVKPMLKLRLLNEAQKICEVIVPSREQIMRARKEAVGISTDHGSGTEAKPSSPSLSVSSFSHPHSSDSSLMLLIEKDLNEVQMQIQSKVSISNSKGKWRSNSLTRGPSPSSPPFSSLSSASFSQNRYFSASSNRSRSITPSKSHFKSLLFPHSLISNRC